MSKLPKYGFWEWRIGAAIFMFPIIIIGMFLFQYIEEKDNPAPSEFSYCFYSDHNGIYRPVRLSRYIQGAQRAKTFYSKVKNDSVIYGEQFFPIIIPGSKVGIIKYNVDSSFVKVRVFPSDRHTVSDGVGWIPSIFIHETFDSTFLAKSLKNLDPNIKKYKLSY